MKNENKLLIPTFGTMEILKIDDISWMQACTNYSRIYLTTGEEVMSTLSFGKLTYQLHEHCILTCHKSYAINLHHLKRYHKDGLAEMKDGSRIPVARRRREDFVIALEDCFGIKMLTE